MNEEKHDFELVHNYVKLMLGALVIEVELTDAQISSCVDAAAEEIFERITKPGKVFPEAYMTMKLQEGTLARAKYLLGKIKFHRSFQAFDITFLAGPENDGWDLMCEGSGDWDDFKQSLTEGR